MLQLDVHAHQGPRLWLSAQSPVLLRPGSSPGDRAEAGLAQHLLTGRTGALLEWPRPTPGMLVEAGNLPMSALSAACLAHRNEASHICVCIRLAAHVRELIALWQAGNIQTRACCPQSL